ncbi:hypothetical protein IW15_13350 [Chryseobacterium soli]|uniref:Uncharacterized protein n=1 Tax=Chryseobacterium soli TaxID=445961 RepID=A0A086A750_9FLAO|nr:hypothetical protein [Chryseobacterium soli]KFF12514.1 hypothetical protein IW15_13350 [Chryseobacterium soli]
MKKTILIAALGIAGLLSAKSAVEIKPKESVTTKEVKVETSEEKTESEAAFQPICISYGMLVVCTDEVIQDTACYDPSIGQGIDYARKCMRDNARLMNEFMCG